MSDYSDRLRALELALKAYTNKAVQSQNVTNTARVFEKYLAGEEVPLPDGAGAFSEEFERGTFTRRDIASLDDDSLSIVRRALTEALQLGHNKIAPEHLLLAIIRDGGTSAAAALVDMAGTGQNARKAVIKRMTQ